MVDSFSTLVSRVERRLDEKLPGPTAQQQLAPGSRDQPPLPTEDRDCREAAVLVLLFPVEDEPFLALTLRGPDMDDHPGQVSFPGGRRESGEEFVETALRETREEVGLAPEAVRVVGRLSSLYIPPTDYCVTPIVGATERRPDWRPDGTEVAEVIETPLGAFLGSEQPTREIWTIDGRDVEVPHFRVEGHQVWGATSMMIAELIAVLREVE